MGNTQNGGNCRKNEVVYKIICRECKDTYIGETARNGHSRGLEHTKDSNSNNIDEQERSVLLRHMHEKHSGKNIKFDMKTVASYQQDPLARQCAEAIYIKSITPEKRINNKTEYHQPGEVEIRYEKNDNTKIKVNGNENKDQEKTQNIDENVRQNPPNDKEQHQKNNQKTIKEFFKNLYRFWFT